MKSFVYFFDKNRDKKVRYSNYKSFEEYLHGAFFWLVSTERFDLTSCCFRCEIDIPFSLLSLEGEEKYVEVDSSNEFLKYLVEESVSKDDFFYLINTKLSKVCTPSYQAFLIKNGDVTHFVDDHDKGFVSPADRLLCIMYILSLFLGGYGCRVADVPLVSFLYFVKRKNYYKTMLPSFDVDTPAAVGMSRLILQELSNDFLLDCFDILNFIDMLSEGDKNAHSSIFQRFVSTVINRIE